MDNDQEKKNRTSRRDFLRVAGASAVAVGLGANGKAFGEAASGESARPPSAQKRAKGPITSFSS
jgi:hypothetical protein